MNDFAVFILTHGRANEQKTIRTLEKCGYTGKLYLIIDDEDSQGKLYKKLYGDKVIAFSKQEAEKTFDTMTNRKEYRSVVYARNASFKIANSLGVRYFMQMDDDIMDLSFRVVRDGKLKGFNITNIDRLFADMAEYMSTANLSILGFSQARAFIGGANSTKYQKGCQRNMSQVTMFDADNPIEIRGILNEDLCVSIDAGTEGRVALATMLVSITSPERTTNKGGLHDLYVDNATYVRDFYSKMAHPGVVDFVGDKKGLHIRINHSAFAPMILNQCHRKERAVC